MTRAATKWRLARLVVKRLGWNRVSTASSSIHCHSRLFDKVEIQAETEAKLELK
jgi:hypothetical protein